MEAQHGAVGITAVVDAKDMFILPQMHLIDGREMRGKGIRRTVVVVQKWAEPREDTFQISSSGLILVKIFVCIWLDSPIPQRAVALLFIKPL